MLNVALVGLLAGSLLTGVPTGGDDKDGEKSKKADVQESVVIVGDPLDNQTIITDTYALGRPAEDTPIKFWIEYGFGEAESIYRPDGTHVDSDEAGACTPITNPLGQTINPCEVNIGGGTIISDGDVKSQRAAVGVQVNPISFSRFRIGVGAILTAAKNEVEGTAGPLSQTGNTISSDFGLQNAKVYVSARGKVLGVHAGYMFDLGKAQNFTDPQPNLGLPALPEDITRSDNRNAIQIGADFDYPIRGFRLFGGIDRYIIGEPDCGKAEVSESEAFGAFCEAGSDSGSEDLFGEEGDGVWNFMLGTGVRISFAEIGVAAQIVARDRQPVDRNGAGTPGTVANIGGYVSTLSPYIRLKPPSLPASIYVKGGVQDEYNVYGLSIDGANGPKTSFGLTFGLSIGFE